MRHALDFVVDGLFLCIGSMTVALYIDRMSRWRMGRHLEQISGPDFFNAVFLAVVGGYSCSTIAHSSFEFFPRALPEWRTLIDQLAFEIGILSGISAATFAGRIRTPQSPNVRWRRIIGAGVLTFMVLKPLVDGSSVLFRSGLSLLGVPILEQQQLEFLSARETKFVFAGWIAIAVVFAPLAEELLFRALLFRYLRTRVRRWLAIMSPAVLFSFLHVDMRSSKGLAAFAPLVVFAIILTLAYEATGSIAVSVIAHSLFNLASILLFIGGQ